MPVIGRQFQLFAEPPSESLEHNVTQLHSEKFQDMHRILSRIRTEKLSEKLKKLNQALSPLLTNIVCITQHTLKLIRWLRVSLESNDPVTQAIQRLGRDLAATF
jgi:hypothetical protein